MYEIITAVSMPNITLKTAESLQNFWLFAACFFGEGKYGRLFQFEAQQEKV
jgi:hypothetical protein